MAEPRIVRIYLEKSLRKSAEAGQHNFIRLMTEVLAERGYRIAYKALTPAECAKGALRPGFSLTHMAPPLGPRGLVFRRAYHYPFWQIDQTAERWNWQVAQVPFVPKPEPSAEVQRFFKFWRRRLFAEVKTTRAGFIYVPLQGLLTQHRSFQSCSPLEMLSAIRAARPEARIVATLHPKERYDDTELAALREMAARDPLLELDTGGMEQYLPRCDLVVTQNSSVAFSGFFLEKPALLYAKIDFHHIALGPEDWHLVEAHRPDYAQYIHWYWQIMSINAGHGSAKSKITQRFDAFGW